jgi:hypothetical protein
LGDGASKLIVFTDSGILGRGRQDAQVPRQFLLLPDNRLIKLLETAPNRAEHNAHPHRQNKTDGAQENPGFLTATK